MAEQPKASLCSPFGRYEESGPLKHLYTLSPVCCATPLGRESSDIFLPLIRGTLGVAPEATGIFQAFKLVFSPAASVVGLLP